MTIQINGMLDGSYVVADVTGETPPEAIASDEALVTYLESHGVTERNARAVIHALREAPRQVVVSLGRRP